MKALDFTDLVYEDRGRLHTISLCPGKRIYGERLSVKDGVEYREWDPRRSKLSAYLTVGGKDMPLESDTKVLYLGASSGTTPSHVADICSEGKVFCVEFAQRMFRDLVRTCETRPNMMPILGDATQPEGYSMFVDSVDVVYQDVAQKRQAEIACANMKYYNAEWGMIAVKAKSEDVTMDEETVFRMSQKVIMDHGFDIVDARSIEPYEKSHQMIVFHRRESNA